MQEGGGDLEEMPGAMWIQCKADYGPCVRDHWQAGQLKVRASSSGWTLCLPGLASSWLTHTSQPQPVLPLLQLRLTYSTIIHSETGLPLQHEHGSAVKPPLTDWAEQLIVNICETVTSPELPGVHHMDGKNKVIC